MYILKILFIPNLLSIRTPDLCRLHNLLEHADGFFFDENAEECHLLTGALDDPIIAKKGEGVKIVTNAIYEEKKS